jgi:hypothetical protein
MRKEHTYILETLTGNSLIVRNVSLQKGQEAIVLFADSDGTFLSQNEMKNLIEALQELSIAMKPKIQKTTSSSMNFGAYKKIIHSIFNQKIQRNARAKNNSQSLPVGNNNECGIGISKGNQPYEWFSNTARGLF